MTENETNARGLLKPLPEPRVREAPDLLPSPDLAGVVKAFWSFRWDLTGHPPYEPEVVNHPSVNLVIQRHASRVVGVSKKRFAARFEGSGHILGTTFHPGCFFPFFKRPVSILTDNALPFRDVFDQDAAELERMVLASDDDQKCVEELQRFLRGVLPPEDPTAKYVKELVGRIAADPEITKVEHLARLSSRNARALQRLFNEYVGVPPKWVIQRSRLQEAVERLKGDNPPSITELSHSLGYFDQAHFVRDFKSIVGRAPSEYVRELQNRS